METVKKKKKKKQFPEMEGREKDEQAEHRGFWGGVKLLCMTL